jgi:hypothetical protein
VLLCQLTCCASAWKCLSHLLFGASPATAQPAKRAARRVEAASHHAADAPPPPKVTGATLYVSKQFGGWRADALAELSSRFDPKSKLFSDAAMAEALAAASRHTELADKNEKMVKAAALPFIKFKIADAQAGGEQVRACALTFVMYACLLSAVRKGVQCTSALLCERKAACVTNRVWRAGARAALAIRRGAGALRVHALHQAERRAPRHPCARCQREQRGCGHRGQGRAAAGRAQDRSAHVVRCRCGGAIGAGRFDADGGGACVTCAARRAPLGMGSGLCCTETTGGIAASFCLQGGGAHVAISERCIVCCNVAATHLHSNKIHQQKLAQSTCVACIATLQRRWLCFGCAPGRSELREASTGCETSRHNDASNQHPTGLDSASCMMPQGLSLCDSISSLHVWTMHPSADSLLLRLRTGPFHLRQRSLFRTR